jgi:lysozyme
MEVTSNGILMTALFEGFSAKPYKCPAGVWTIGYGSTFYENGTKVTPKDPAISVDRATSLLSYHMRHFAQTVNSYTTDAIKAHQFDALVDFAYNVGLAALKSSTLLRKVNAKPNDPTISTEFAKWIYGGDGSRNKKDDDGDGLIDEAGEKQRLNGLVKRRTAEALLYTKGIYTTIL